tara:strand:- start:51 stop:992 length:942 start_codon:yes stop_codon:yes gene_type:complete
MKLKHLDLFSGIGGFHLGFQKAGFELETYFSEIDKYAIDVYKHNFKNSKYVGSVTDIQSKDLPKIDLITFGSPCQDFSLAGKRKGMQGAKSSLISEAIRLISECRPRFFVWENVKGTFSSNNSEDFWAIIQAFTNIGGYRLEWQLLNTSWFLPQNRERIYLVGYLGEKSGKEIFPIKENAKKINELQRQQANTNTLTTRYTATGSGSYITERKFIPQKIGDYRYDEGFRWRKDNNSPTLTLLSSKIYIKKKEIRRLTPLECERLQGFPDNWTQKGCNDLISDGQRYKMCGNAVTVDVVEAVAKKIKSNFNYVI